MHVFCLLATASVAALLAADAVAGSINAFAPLASVRECAYYPFELPIKEKR